MNKILLPVVVDIETSGLDLVKSGIWQIGAVDLNTMEEFLDEGRIDDEDEIEKEALIINKKTEKDLRNRNKQSQVILLNKFMEWINNRKIKNFVCQNPQFDMGWILSRISKYELKRNFHHRAFDLHSIAQTRFFDLNNEFLIEEEHSDMGLSNILKLCGFPGDSRGAHNALEDAKLTAECFNRLIFGKNLFPEFSKFEVPTELKK